MISFTCDRCERTIEVKEDKAGAKMECPHCGDMNIIPEHDGENVGEGTPEAAPAPARRPAAAPDAAPFPASHREAALAKAGLPPAAGPEQTVVRVHPAMFRAIPGLFVLLFVLFFGGLIGGGVFAFRAGGQPVLMWLCFAVAALALVCLFIWWLRCKSVTLEITNKRTIRNIGLLSKSTSEVSHDTIRNFQVRQSFLGRILNVGSIGISSAGQDEVEITVDHIARPMHLRKIIDTYRHD